MYTVPGLHILNNSEIILMSLYSPLELVEEVPQLHQDHKTSHAQEYVAP